MKTFYKMGFATLGCVLSAWGGAVLGLLAIVNEEPVNQGVFSILSALLISISILFAGWGNSLWKRDNESDGEQ